jgi:hypothetical protein
MTETVNGQPWPAIPNLALASQLCLESHGNVIIDGPAAANSEFFGTVFAPYGSISTGANDKFIGSLLSGGTANLAFNSNLTYEPSAYVATLAVPEPASAALAMVGGILLLRRRR